MCLRYSFSVIGKCQQKFNLSRLKEIQKQYMEIFISFSSGDILAKINELSAILD